MSVSPRSALFPLFWPPCLAAFFYGCRAWAISFNRVGNITKLGYAGAQCVCGEASVNVLGGGFALCGQQAGTGKPLSTYNEGIVCNCFVGKFLMASWWFVGLVSGILFTPGPTNTLLATAGLQSGWARAGKLIPFELAGYVVAISVWGYAWRK